MRQRAGTWFEPLLGLVGIAAACVVALGLLAGSASAISNLPKTSGAIVVNGTVNAVVTSGSTIVFGGAFTAAGPYTGGFASVPLAGGTLASLPAINGTVNAVASDGSGGWYVGGSFTAAGSSSVTNLVHLTSGGGVDTAWNPAPDGQVDALALSSDKTTLYVGGAFATIGGATRNHIAALTASSGAVTVWNPNADATVTTLLLSPDGATLYAAGSFTAIGGSSRAGLVALATSSGAATAWNPNPSSTGTVSALAVSPDGTTVYEGGSFTSIGGSAISKLAAIPASGSGTATAANITWATAAAPNGTVGALAVSPNGATVYAGGTFTSVGGQARTDLGAISASTGSATSWDPSPSDTVTALAVSSTGSPIYAGGTFSTIGGKTRQDVAALSATDATATSWQEDTNGQVSALAVTSTAVGVGGALSGVGLQTRDGLAAITTSGSLLDFNPDVTGGSATVDALALSPDASTLYVGGSFTSIGGQSRASLASVSLATGLVGSWNPGVSGSGATVNALASGKDAGGNVVVYVGGNFTKIASTTQKDIGEIDSTGMLVSWNPNVNNVVNAFQLATDSNGHVTTVYAGGQFSSVNGSTTYKYVAALDPTSASISGTWTSRPAFTGSTVDALALSGSTLYIGGGFSKVNGVTNSGKIAALTASTGAANALWLPNPNGNVTALAVSTDGS
ncbi:MAG TPA: hypothetical protein VJ986_14450, partial [Gaiellaceae bacterium]|nr:hypothetical protein [Gaiellaceae bacterium]